MKMRISLVFLLLINLIMSQEVEELKLEETKFYVIPLSCY